MADERIAETIAAKLRAGIIWPGDPEKGIKPRPIALPFGVAAGRPKEMEDLLDETVKQLSEAVVHVIEADTDSVIIPRDQLGEIQAAAGETPDKGASIPIFCHCDKTMPLLLITMTHHNKVVLDGSALIRTLGQRAATHPHKWIESDE